MCIKNGFPRNSKRGFRSSLVDTVNDLSRKAIVIVGRNLDGHVGRASNDDANGKHGKSVRNVGGDNILDWPVLKT